MPIQHNAFSALVVTARAGLSTRLTRLQPIGPPIFKGPNARRINHLRNTMSQERLTALIGATVKFSEN
jgi:hypothetical protein